jgi:putative hydrolase of HD superfamily
MEHLIKFFDELGLLKKMQRTGWLLIGAERGDTVAAHSFRVAVIAYCLAEMKGLNPEKVAVMGLIHDIPETRIGDINKVQAGYVQADERKAAKDIFPRSLHELFLQEK